MYIKEIDVENLGPLEKANIKFSFNEDGSPKPLVLVGKNGSGKSTLISNIVDSFYEFASIGFNNIKEKDPNNALYSCFYKILSPEEIKNGKTYLYSRIVFDNDVNYVFANGAISKEKLIQIGGKLEDLQTETGHVSFKRINLKNSSNVKNIVRENLSEQVFAYFPPNRYEKPNWLHESYYKNAISENFYNEFKNNLKFKNNIDRGYRNQITVNCGEDNFAQWLLDVIVDSLSEFNFDLDNEQRYKVVDGDKKFCLKLARNNIEKILSTILVDNVKFELKPRFFVKDRLTIVREASGNLFLPSLSSLSSGQYAIFKMFATIVRYADSYDITSSITLKNIVGIVVIDEIELHLHPSMQADVLPKLIELFPKVQFIITTHSPIFLLGMDKELGKGSYDLIDLPSVSKISTESFSEFISAFKCYENTAFFEKELQSVLSTLTSNSNGNSPLIITEGQTDWVHLEAAYRALSQDSKNKVLFSKLGNIKFFEYEAKDQSHLISELGFGIKGSPLYKGEMGDTSLQHLCESFSKLPRNNLVICIFDRDNNEIFKKVTNNGNYKDWGNNVYSFAIPIPNEDREKTPLISIEHYYSDNEIKTTQLKGDVECRLYMGCEFDSFGRMIDGNKLCNSLKKCGEDKINILSRGNEKIICKDSSDQNDYSLSKADFAWNIYNKRAGFNNFDFSNFIKIFEMIRDIIEHHNSQKQKESPVNVVNDGQKLNTDQ